MIRFHLDESVNNRLAIALRQRGIDVTIPVDVGLVSASDEQHLVHALSENRVLVTHDADFLTFHEAGTDLPESLIARRPPGPSDISFGFCAS